MKQNNIKATVLSVAALLAASALANANGKRPFAPLVEFESQQRAGANLFHAHPARNDDWKKRRELGQERRKKDMETWRERFKKDQELRRQRQQDDADWRRENNLLNPNREPSWKRNRDIQQERRKKDMEIRNRRFFEDQKHSQQRRKEDAGRWRQDLLKTPGLNRGRSQGLNKDRDCPELKDDGRFRLKPRC